MPKTQPQQNGGAEAHADESPVVGVLQKRLRNLRKRVRNVEGIQQKAEAGKALNQDEESALASRPGLLAAIDELEKMAAGLKDALKEELSTAAAEARKKALADAEKAAAKERAALKGEADYAAEREAAVAAATKAAKEEAEAAQEKAAADAAAAKAVAAARAEARAAGVEEAAGTLVDLMYLGNNFDCLTRAPVLANIAFHERGSAVAYAQHFGVPLTDEDLSALVLLCHSLSMRLPLGAPISHAEALQHCQDIAAKLLARSPEQQVIPPGAPPATPLSYAELVDKLQAVKSLQLFPLVPPYPVPNMLPHPASKPASPAPGADEASAVAPAAAPRTVSPGTAELPTAEQAAASGENLVGHFFGFATAVAAPAAEAAEAPAPAPSAELAAAKAGAGPGEERYPVVHQEAGDFASPTSPPADAMPHPLSFAGDKSLGISEGAPGASGAAEAAAGGDSSAAGAAGQEGTRSGRGGGRGGGAWGGRGRGRGDYVPRAGRGEGEGGRGYQGRGGYRGRGEGEGGRGYQGRGGYRGRGDGEGGRGYQGRSSEGGYQGRSEGGYQGRGGWGGRGRGGRSGAPVPSATQPVAQPALL